MNKQYCCPKCNGWEYEAEEIRVTGSGLSRFFDVQNRRFTVVSCKKCGYSELYKIGRGSVAGSILDFLTSS